MRKINIEYQVFGGLSFYQRKEIKDILAYLRLIENLNDEESLRRIINFPSRGIGQTTLDKLTLVSEKQNISLFDSISNLNDPSVKINKGTIEKLENFRNQILSFKVFSQNGEDGIIDYLIYALNIRKIKFVEIGVGDYTECNTRFLINNYPFRGLLCDINSKLKDTKNNSEFFNSMNKPS